MTISCDLFCAVVDNLGDAAVCWRLSRQLAREHGWSVRLWIDDRDPLALLCPGIDPSLDRQIVEQVEVRHWSMPFPAEPAADVVIEAFACELPGGYLDAMAKRPERPVWINLEYLSAEDWILNCHAQPSPHPTLPLVKYFFFPGFVAGTGGLIRERELKPAPPLTWPKHTLTVSLFCYDNPALPQLLDVWAKDSHPLHCRVTEGLTRRQVATWLDDDLAIGTTTQRGNLTLEALPFVPQQDYDRLLSGCGLNFVRGEDSFVRALWAERPFVWQIYPQAHGSHREKLDAFLERYCAGLPPATRGAVSAFWRAWNGWGDIRETWPEFRAALPDLGQKAASWAREIAQPGNLAENLVKFCTGKI